jgi:hypothetical protein
MTSDEYGRLLYRIREDVETSAAAFYTFREINRFALEGGESYAKLNRDAGFWNLQIHGLHTAYFMGLGRLFDKPSSVSRRTQGLGQQCQIGSLRDLGRSLALGYLRRVVRIRHPKLRYGVL